MKAAKTTIKIIIILAVIASIAVGAYFLKTKGLNFPENGVYTQNNILEVAKPYMIKMGICLALVVIYFMIRYNKLGAIKTGLIALAVILALQALVIAVMAIARLEINRMFFSGLLSVFVLTILALTAVYEKNLK